MAGKKTNHTHYLFMPIYRKGDRRCTGQPTGALSAMDTIAQAEITGDIDFAVPSIRMERICPGLSAWMPLKGWRIIRPHIPIPAPAYRNFPI